MEKHRTHWATQKSDKRGPGTKKPEDGRPAWNKHDTQAGSDVEIGRKKGNMEGVDRDRDASHPPGGSSQHRQFGFHKRAAKKKSQAGASQHGNSEGSTRELSAWEEAQQRRQWYRACESYGLKSSNQQPVAPNPPLEEEIYPRRRWSLRMNITHHHKLPPSTKTSQEPVPNPLQGKPGAPEVPPVIHRRPQILMEKLRWGRELRIRREYVVRTRTGNVVRRYKFVPGKLEVLWEEDE